jgi:hypothetical protein
MTFMQSFYDSLSDEGILVMQLGEAADFDSPDETHSKFKNRVAAVNLLERVGFESIHAYEEVSDHCRPFLSSFYRTDFFFCSVTLWIYEPVDLFCRIQVLQYTETVVRQRSGDRASHSEA